VASLQAVGFFGASIPLEVVTVAEHDCLYIQIKNQKRLIEFVIL
jgi:hypothetical protein